MSEKKNVIEIPVPAGYEQCERGDATHVLLDGKYFCEYSREERLLGSWRASRITAYLREVPKPEPFRVVLEDCEIVQNTIYPEGQCRATLTAWGKGLLDADFPGKRYRVTIEEVLPNGL